MSIEDQCGHLITHVVRHDLDSALAILERLESCPDVPAIDLRYALDRLGDTSRRRVRPRTSAPSCFRGGIEVPGSQLTVSLLQERTRGIGEVPSAGERDDRAERNDGRGQFLAHFGSRVGPPPGVVARRARCGQERDGCDRPEERRRAATPACRGHRSPNPGIRGMMHLLWVEQRQGHLIPIEVDPREVL
ncbi:MAG: hypothetical protein M3460_11710 [Actinomycetota bacterium]|nr:hypothetical protein [Actinomycetota bacterium]